MSDKYDEVAERIHGGSFSIRWSEAIAQISAILREAFPASSGQGEDERVLNEAFTAWLDGEYDKESFLFGFHFDKGQREGSVAGYRNMATGFRAGYLAALLRSEPRGEEGRG